MFKLSIHYTKQINLNAYKYEKTSTMFYQEITFIYVFT